MTTTYSILHSQPESSRPPYRPPLPFDTCWYSISCIVIVVHIHIYILFLGILLFKKFYFILFPLTWCVRVCVYLTFAPWLDRLFSFSLLLLCVNVIVSVPSIGALIYNKYVLCAWHYCCLFVVVAKS